MTFSKFVAAILCFAAVSPGTGAVAQQQGAGVMDETGAPPLQLSLTDAVRMGLENNLDIRVANKNPQISEQLLLVQDAVFDPNFGFLYQKQELTSPSINITDIGLVDPNDLLAVEGTEETLFALNQEFDNFNFAWFDPLTWGASWEASAFFQRAETSSRNALVPVTYFSQVQLAYNQSLLRNFGKDANRTQIIIAQNDYDISKSDYRDQVQRSLQQIEDAYWELVFARQDLAVKNESLGLAQELLKLNRIKVDVGTLPPIEITQAEAEVAAREQAVIIAENALGDAEDNLRRAMNMPKDEGAWARPIVPSDEPAFVARAVDLPRELEEAYASRPDLERARLNLQTADTRLAFDKNQLKWDLDFRGTYRMQGLSGDDLTVFIGPTPTVLPINEDFGDSIGRLGTDFDSWTAQLALNIPVGNNTAQANYLNSRLTREQSSITYDNTRLAAEVEVRAAARGILSDQKRIEAAEKNVELQRKKVEAEQKKFENGMSTSFQVLEFQEDLTTALGDKNRALVDYRKSITELERAKGTLDRYLNVALR